MGKRMLIAALLASGLAGATEKDHQRANCPSAVLGATTSIEDLTDGVVVVVTGTDEATRDEIRRRAHLQVGLCPGMIEGAQITVEDVPDGAQLSVRAETESEVRSLQQMTRARLRKLTAKR